MTDKVRKKMTLIRRPVDPARKRYYLVDNDLRIGGGGAYRIINEKDFVDPEHPDWPALYNRAGKTEIREYAGKNPEGADRYFGGWYGLPSLPAKPQLEILLKRDGSHLDVLGPISTPFLSDRAKKLLESIDPDAFEFLECEAFDRKKRQLPPVWMTAVKRVVKSFDVENSIFRDYGIKTPLIMGHGPGLTKLYDIRMSSDMPDSYHAFYLIQFRRLYIFDQFIVDKWREHGFTGIFFTPLQPPTPEELKKVNQFKFYEYYYEEYRNSDLINRTWGDLV